MSDWETAGDGWETAGGGWESPDKVLLPSTDFKHAVPEVKDGSVVRQPDFKDERSFAGKAKDYLKGNLEATANVAGNLVAFPAGLVYGAATGDIEKGVEKASSLAYQPKTEEGQDILHAGQPVFDTLMALTGMPPILHHANVPLSRAKTVKPSPKDVAGIIQAEKEKLTPPETTPVDTGPAVMDKIVESQISGEQSPLRSRVDPMEQMKEQLGFERQDKVQQILDSRQAELEQEVKRQGNLDYNAAERTKQDRAPIPGIDQVPEVIAAREQLMHTPEFMKTQNEGIAPDQPFMGGGIGRGQRGGMLIDFKPKEEKIPVGETTELDALPPASLQIVKSRDLSGMSKDLEATERPGEPGSTAQVIDISTRLSGGPGGRQRGAMLIPGSSKPPKESTSRAPTTPEDVALKQEREKKVLALKLTGTPYESVHTLEDAMSNPGKDISNNAVRDALSSGIAGQVYRNSSNRLLKYGRTIFTEARQNSEAFISKYVTGKDGVNRSYQKLDAKEWNDVANALQEGSKAKYKLTPELMTKLTLNDKQQDVINKIYTALDEMYVMGNDALMKQGFNPFEYHEGYVPSMFSGAYTSLVYKGNKLISVAQADTRWGHNKAKDYFKGQEGIRFVDLPRRGLNDEVGRSRVYSGFNDIVAQIAKSDPEFAKMKLAVDQHVADSSKRLYQFDLHENTKKNIGGALGDKPWLDQQTNARQFLEGMIHYLEEGSRYYSYQDAMNKAGEIVSKPELKETHPNTLNYIEKYAKHVAGHDLSALGAVLNGGIDTVFKIAGVGPGVPKKMMEGIRTLMTAHMMGTYNPAFLATQLSQYWTGGLPEAAAIREAMGLKADDMVGAWHKMTWQTAAIAIENKLGKTLATIDPHMRDAFNWGAEHGITHFTEAQLSHNAQQSTGMRVAKGLANAPTILGEAATRPAIFMWYADLFHRAGMEGDQLHTTAKEATDYAMVNYHPDERPMIYSQLGYMGQFIGTLSTFKHNLLEQWTSRTLNSVKQPAALAMMLGTGYVFYGLSGLPGYQEADNLFQNITGMTIREFAGQNLQPNNLWDGVVSTVTGLDFQNRMSMANVIPDSPGAGLAGAYLSNFADILMKAGKYAWDQDVASRNDAIRAVTPLGLRGVVDEKLFTDEHGFALNTKGQRKYDTPRTKEERNLREVTGIRPIRERLEDEDVYADRKSVAKQNDKQHEQYNRMIAASNLQDEAGFTAAYNKWLKEGGDPKDITNQAIKDMIVNGKLSERQRRGGIGPKNSIKSINKYEAYHDN